MSRYRTFLSGVFSPVDAHIGEMHISPRNDKRDAPGDERRTAVGGQGASDIYDRHTGSFGNSSKSRKHIARGTKLITDGPHEDDREPADVRSCEFRFLLKYDGKGRRAGPCRNAYLYTETGSKGLSQLAMKGIIHALLYNIHVKHNNIDVMFEE